MRSHSALRNVIQWIAGILLVISIFHIVLPTYADIGPKDRIDFRIVYQVEGISIIDAELIHCRDPECNEVKPPDELMYDYFRCSKGKIETCTAFAYTYGPYHMLVIEFSDKTRNSNVFKPHGIQERYQVTVLESSLRVEPSIAPIDSFGSALCGTWLIEGIVAIIYFAIFRLSKTAFALALFSSLLSLPVVWFVFPGLRLPGLVIVGLSEVFAIGFEAGFVFLASGRKIALKHTLVASILMNLASFIVGIFT